WWGSASESGWGINLTQQGSVLFATWFTYDASGNGQWLVMSSGTQTGTNSYGGTLYRTTGSPFNAVNASSVTASAVGTATLTFSDPNNGTFTATVDGSTVTKAITRQVWSASQPVCTAGSSTATTNYQDLWWHVGGTESGWGVNIAQQGDTMFLTWFT